MVAAPSISRFWQIQKALIGPVTGLVAFGIHQLKLKDVVVNEKRVGEHRMVGLIRGINSCVVHSCVSGLARVVSISNATEDSNAAMRKRQVRRRFEWHRKAAIGVVSANRLCWEDGTHIEPARDTRIGFIGAWEPLVNLFHTLFCSLPDADVKGLEGVIL